MRIEKVVLIPRGVKMSRSTSNEQPSGQWERANVLEMKPRIHVADDYVMLESLSECGTYFEGRRSVPTEDFQKKLTLEEVVPNKKRPAESTYKTPAADKKVKVTPQKTDGKKANVHVATPPPAKQAKTPANEPNQQTPKSGGTHSCTSCNKAF